MGISPVDAGRNYGHHLQNDLPCISGVHGTAAAPFPLQPAQHCLSDPHLHCSLTGSRERREAPRTGWDPSPTAIQVTPGEEKSRSRELAPSSGPWISAPAQTRAARD